MATLYVGTSEGYYSTITDAVAAANDGDTIIIATGDYTAEGEIQINNALTVKAAEDAEVIVDHVVLGSSFNDQNVSAVTVSGLIIKPTAHNGGDWHYTGVWQNNINISAITIENCVIDFSNTPDDVASVGIKLSRGDVGDAVETLEITGNTIIGTDKTQSYITVGAKGSISSVTVEGNECYGGSSSSAVTLDFGYKATGEVSVVVKDNAIADVTNGHGINFGNVKNSDIDITVTGNTVENVTGEGRAAINMHNTSTSVGDVTISDNTIANSTVGVDLTAIAENNTSIDVTENKITVVAGNNAFAGYTPADDANTVTVIESATSIIVDASITGNAGDIVAINGKNYIMGTNAFANLTDAVNAASATAATTITLAAGTYAEDITLDARTMEQKGNLKFVAAEGEDVTFTGKFTIGYYEKRVGSQKWDADVTFEGITFDQAADATHSIDIQQVNDFTMTNCKVIGDGEWGMSGTNVDNGATITGTTFENAGIQSAGSFGTNLLIDDCTFDDSRVNIQSGNSVTIQNSTFDATVTDENVGDSFYCIRSNDNAIVITNTTFNIDSEVTGTAADQEKWGVLWQRNAGGTKWTATDIKVNFTDAALAQSELLFNKNGTTNAANEADRITIKGITSDADVADIIAKSEGSLVAISGSTYGFYYDGVLQDSCDLREYLVDANITPELDKYIPNYMLGVNAFTSFTDALKNLTPYTEKITIQTALTESASADKITVALAQDLVIDGNDQTVEWNEGSNWIWFKKADGVEGDVTVSFENFNLNASEAKKSFFFGTDIAVDENSSINIWNASIQATGKVNVAAGGEFNVAKEELQIQEGGSLNVTGYEDFVAANAALADRQVFLQYSRNVYGDINVTDSYMAIFQDIRLKDNATFTADNALIQFGTGADGVWHYNPVPNGYGNLIVNGENSVFTLQNGSILEISGNVTNNGTINIDNSTFLANGTLVSDGVIAEAYNKGVVTNNGTIRVSGESTLNVATFNGNTIDLMDGAIIKDSTVGGGVFVAGNVTFRGDNTFGMLSDFGTLTDYYGTTAPMAWTVEAGASVTLSNKARYGLGYGDKVVINGEIAANGAAAARATLTDDDATNDVKQSLFMHGLVAQESSGWNCDSSFTVNNAFVTIGSNSSFGSKAGNYGGNYTFSFTNSVLNASRITFYNTNAKTTFTLTGSDVELGQFMTRDQDSVFTLDNTKLYSTSTINGNDEGQYNAGTLNVLNGSTLTYTSAMTNEATGKIVISADSKLIAPEIIMADGSTITIDGTNFAGGVETIIDVNSGSLSDKVTLINGDGLTMFHGADGDVMLTDASTDTLYVNAAWADKKAGDLVEDGKVFGVNAFATSKAAYMAARNLGGEITIDLSAAGAETLDGTVGFGNAGKDGVYTITGGSVNTTSYGIYINDPMDITVKFDNATFKLAKLYVESANGELIVNNSVIGTAAYSGHNSGWVTALQGDIKITDSIFGMNFANYTEDEIKAMPRSASDVKAAVEAGTYKYWAFGSNNSGPHMGTTDEISVTDSTLSATWISLIDRAEMNLNNSVLYYGAAISIGAGQVDSSLGEYNSNEIGWDAQIWWGNSPAASKDGFREGEVATLNITDSIVHNIGSGNGNDGAHVQVGGSVTYGNTPVVGQDFAGVLNLKNSEFYITPYDADGNAIEKEYDFLAVKSNGTVNMENSKLVTAKVINEGVFTVTGESTLEITTATGNRIQIADGATLVDSKVGGSVTMLGDMAIDGDLTLTGGLWASKGGKLSGDTVNAYYAMFQTGEYTIDADLELDYGYLSYGGTFTVSSTIHTVGTSGEVLYVRGVVDLIDGGVLDADKGLFMDYAGASLNVNAGTRVDAASVKLTVADTQLNILGGEVKAANEVHNAGSITINATGSLTAATLTGAGSFVIDASEFAADSVKTIVDVNSSTFTGSITVTGNDDAKVFRGEDGDIILTTLPTEVIYFDAAFAGEFGDDLGDGKYYGINAFSKFDTTGVDTDKGWSNLMVLPEDTTEIVLTAGNGDDASYGMLRPTQSLTVKTDGEGYAVIDRFVNVIGNLTFDKDAKVKVLTAKGLSGANNQGTENGEQSKITVNGEVYIANGNSSNKPLYLWGMTSNPGYLLINEGGKLIAEAGDVENRGTIEVKGYMELGAAGNAPKLAGVGAGNDSAAGHLIVDGAEAKLVVKHNQVNFGGGNNWQDWEDAKKECTVTIKNGAVVETAAVSFRNGQNSRLEMDGGSLIFNDGSAYGVDYSDLTPRYFDNQGEMNVSNSTINMTGRTFANDGVMNFTGANTVVFGSLAGAGEINFSGATMNDSAISGDFSGAVNFEGDNVISGGTFNLASAELFADDGTFTIKNGAAVTFGADCEIYADITVSAAALTIAGGVMDANIAVADKGTLTLTDDLKLSEGVTITLDNGDLDLVNGTLTGKNGQLVMDHESTITFDDVITAGTLTVDTSDYTAGTYKLFDYVGTGSMSAADYEALLGDVMNNDKILVLNNDLFLTDQDMSTLYVNADLSDKEAGTVLADGNIVGFNAFGDFVTAIGKITDATEEIKIQSDIANVLPIDVEFRPDHDIAINADSKVTVALSNNGTSYDLLLNPENNAKVTIAENITLTLNDRIIWGGYYGNNGNVIINGTVSAYQWWNGVDTTVNAGGKLSTVGEAMVFRRGATLTINGDAALGAAAADRTVQLDANYYNFLSGHLVAENTYITGGNIWVSNSGSYTYEGGVSINIDNTIWESSQNMKLNGENVVFNIANQSSVSVVLHDGVPSEIGAKAQLNLTGKSTFTSKTLTNSGTISITDSTFVVDGTLTNNGTVNVSGVNTLQITALNGNAVVKFDNATLSADSTIGGNAVIKVYGESVINGTVTNTIHANWAGEKVDNLYAGYTTDDVVLTLNGATATGNIYIGSDTEGYGAALNVNSSTVGGIYNRTQGSVEITGADNTVDYINNKGSLNIKNAENTYIEALVAEGSQIVIADSDVEFAIGTSNCIELKAGTAMTVLDSTVKFQTVSIDAASMLTLSGTTVNVDGVYDYSGDTITNNGIITITDSTIALGALSGNGKVSMDTASQIIWSGSLSGSVTVDLSDYVDGKKQLFDYTGSETITDAYYQNIISNTWSNAFYVENGDLYYDFAKVTHTVDATEDYVIPEGTEFVVVDPGDNTLNHADTNLAVNGIEAVVKSGIFEDTISGGAVASSSDYKTWDDDTFDTNLTVEGGTFNKIVMGGTRVDKGNSEQIGDSNLTITGGTFNSQVVGGMAYADSSLRGNAILTGDVNLTISGGTFSSWIYGGSISGKGTTSGNTLIDGDITITIDASSKAITFADDAHIVAGSYQNGVVDGSTKVVFTGLSANLGMDADNLVWGGSSADVYINKADGSRVFQTVVTGDRTVSFDAFDGDFAARIRGFNTLEAVNDADVTALAGDLSDIEFWNFDTDSSIAGSFRNNFAGDKFDVDVTGWDNNEATLFSGDVTGFEDMTVTVTLGDETATLGWDAEFSRYANDSYQLTFDAENKVVKFGALA